MDKPKIIVVVGPTAAGKTSLAIAIAKQFDGEIISADSRQVYRGLDIGTAKATLEEMGGVPHHLIDIADIDTVYTVADFTTDAAVAIRRIKERNRVPIIAGGTFFYIDALLGDTPVSVVPPNPTLRAELEQKQHHDLYAALEKLDPRRAAEIDPGNKRRLIRALEIVAELGAVPEPHDSSGPYDALKIGITVEKETLRANFKKRAETWLENGFQQEVETLLTNGVSRDRLTEIGFEYLLMLEYLDGNCTKEAFIEKFVQKNWQYAKRQYTWLKRDKSIRWETPENREAIFRHIEAFLN